MTGPNGPGRRGKKRPARAVHAPTRTAVKDPAAADRQGRTPEPTPAQPAAPGPARRAGAAPAKQPTPKPAKRSAAGKSGEQKQRAPKRAAPKVPRKARVRESGPGARVAKTRPEVAAAPGAVASAPGQKSAPRPEPPSRSVLTTPPGPPADAAEFERESILFQFEQRPLVEPPANQPPLERRPAGAPRRLAFVLHAHLPWVLGHGTWPHGEDWLAEAIAHCYLPLIDTFRRLANRGRKHLATISVTPVLGAMLADPRTEGIVDRYLAERSKAAWDDRRRHPLALWWRGEYERLQALWAGFDKNLSRALADLSDRGALELSTSAGTHVYLPLAHSSKLVRLALRTGRETHRERFGVDPRGCWMPECAYRPGGPWRHPVTGISEENRAGNEDFLAEQGLGWTVVDSHLLRAGDPAFPYGSDRAPEEVVEPSGPHPRPYWIRQSPVAAFLRDARSAAQVWSRQGGYPGDGAFLDFHKRHWPSGLRLWRVTDADVDMMDKLVYWPEAARERAEEQAEHFLELVAGLEGMDGGVACAPFDMELFGHWWFEGPLWLERVLELAAPGATVEATTPARELDSRPALQRAFFAEGSWGAGGDHRVWVNPETEWMWQELADLERRAFAAVRWGGARKWRRAILNQLLLTAASDWPFLVKMGTGRDYAEERFKEHARRTRELIDLGPRSRAWPEWVDLDLPFGEIEAEWARAPEE